MASLPALTELTPVRLTFSVWMLMIEEEQLVQVRELLVSVSVGQHEPPLHH